MRRKDPGGFKVTRQSDVVSLCVLQVSEVTPGVHTGAR